MADTKISSEKSAVVVILRSASALIVCFMLDLNFCMFEIRLWAIEGGSLRERPVPFPTPVSTGSGSKGSLLLKEGSVSDPCQVTPKEDSQRRWVTSACQEWPQKNSIWGDGVFE